MNCNVEIIKSYDTLSFKRRLLLSMMELPSHLLSVYLRRVVKELDLSMTQLILTDSLSSVDLTVCPIRAPEVTHFLGSGHESSVYLFHSDGAKWVTKIGRKRAATIGLISPSQREYAQMLEWNYAVLSEYFLGLSTILPSPYAIVSPEKTLSSTTVQIAPYFPKLPDPSILDKGTIENLVLERRFISSVSNRLREEQQVLPELLGGSSNLRISLVNGEPHWALVDIGLHHLRAPSPVYYIANIFAQRISLRADIAELHRVKSS